MSTRIIIKFRRNVVEIPYQDAAQFTLPPFLAAAWQEMIAMFPSADLSLDRLLTSQTGPEIAALLDAARLNSGQEPPDLLSLMAISVDGFADTQALVSAARELPFVEFAYEESPLAQPTVNPSNDPLAALQGYLLPAPFGVDALFAWSLAGADGANVRFLDIERGWQLNHEDLVGGGIAELNVSVPGNEQHSTECLGIVMAQDNNRGIIGLAPQVKAAIASSLRPALPDALLLAVGFLGSGDVLLIEEQTVLGTPVETDAHIALLVRALTLLGIIVIEPAGNGSRNLDLELRADGPNGTPNGTGFDRNAFNFFDSGAIVVGARNVDTRTRRPLSSFGNRVDGHAWGERIVTTSSIPTLLGPYVGLNPLAGDMGFGETSGASAIIAGAAIVLQGIARAKGAPLTPARMRELLAAPFNTGTDTPDAIGVMPDLRAIAQHL